jgi:hypothetical protein
MPTSQPRSLSLVHGIVQRLNPDSVIDVGVGHGKTGVLLREYLDVMQLRYKPSSWKTMIYGIEAFSEYRNPIWDYVYDEVLVQDALQAIELLPQVDLVIALDVWEHFAQVYAEKFLRACLDKARFTLICTPKSPGVQADVYGNDYERHVSTWSPLAFASVRYQACACTREDWIVLLSGKEPIGADIQTMMSAKASLLDGIYNWISIAKLRSARRRL